jgi:hypothetical protein
VIPLSNNGSWRKDFLFIAGVDCVDYVDCVSGCGETASFNLFRNLSCGASS